MPAIAKMSTSDRDAYFAQCKAQLYKESPMLGNLPVELKRMVMSNLTVEGLARLGRTCRFWYNATTPELYTKDAKEGHSYAMSFAARAVGARETEAALRVLDLSARFGGSPNTSHSVFAKREGVVSMKQKAVSILYAAMTGNKEIVRKLLDLGARLDKPCSGTGWAMRLMGTPELAARLRHFGSFYPGRIGYGRWYPLFLAFIRDDHVLGQLLVEAGAPAHATLSTNHQGPVELRQTSILHFAACNKANNFDKWEFLFEAFAGDINDISAEDMYTPLHLAMKSGSIKGMEAALRAGADYEARDFDFHTPLMVGIKRIPFIGNHGFVRQQHMSCIHRLVGWGADVNPDGDSILVPLFANYQSTLMISSDVEDLLYFLLDHGADINGRSITGSTPLREMVTAIISMTGAPAIISVLRRILRNLVRRGMDLSSPRWSRDSPLFTVMKNQDAQPAWLFNFLWKNGAVIHDREIDDFFLKWCHIPRLHGRGQYDMWQHAASISAGAVETAYKIAFEMETPTLYNLLVQKPLRQPPVGRVVMAAFLASQPWGWRKIVASPIDENFFTTPQAFHENLLHLTVRAYNNMAKYTTAEAMEDVMTLIKRGVSVTHTNTMGHSPADLFDFWLPVKSDVSNLVELVKELAEKEYDRQAELQLLREHHAHQAEIELQFLRERDAHQTEIELQFLREHDAHQVEIDE
ncbi:hypothetical protein E4U41_002682 [Claviceps citrina]|nr:hypothetical protein E4U41_002682 [Claviceps citrina]